ncbi:hypothetical protein E4T49_03201 [Aureobasidium sp. EXF-10728]|nr:hypothetical protein E4T49_03201 [Aureobasidium sp. EXF-10728]
MPGILPMKVIKVGTSAQSRIAQACDRCRSKKIRCDGIRPSCSQCTSVGFECKTSDKLSRRAFPRGYTESLEERVRSLEAEVRELKELLDEKDEKIDMLSKLHSASSQSAFQNSPRRPSASPAAPSPNTTSEDVFQVQQTLQLDGNGTNAHFAGTSSGKAFYDAFSRRVQELGRASPAINVQNLLPGSTHIAPRDPLSDPIVWKAPARLESDQLIGVFFQEWAPLFPILHRPTFLELYQSYMSAPENVIDNCSHAQLNLVFGIAALSSGSRDTSQLQSYETQWQAAIDTILSDHSMPTLQCLVLAQLYCMQRGDYDRLLTYKALAVTLSSRLGLHQSQKRFALGASTSEMRKKVFWSLYTVDCFSAVTLGLPKQLKDEDVHCEEPRDADEEYVDETGFKAPCPGEYTRVSSALALFRAARILSRVLEDIYPARSSYDLSLQQLSALSEELDAWHNALAPHLRLPFANDKPTTGTVSSRSPLLSLTYHFIRALIHRPAVCASLGPRASSSLLAMAASSKHSIQIIELLSERGLSFSFCINKDELLVLSGLGLLFQSLELGESSKLVKDNQKMTSTVVNILTQTKAPSATEFQKLTPSRPANSTQLAAKQQQPPLSRHNSDGAVRPVGFSSNHGSASPTEKNRFKAAAQRLMAKNPFDRHDQRRATFPNISLHHNAIQTQSQPIIPQVSTSEPAYSPANPSPAPLPASASARPSAPPNLRPVRSFPQQQLNLDYLSFSNVPTRTHSPDGHASIKQEPSDWERLLGSLDNGQTNIFDNIYGGPPVEFLDAHHHQNVKHVVPMASSLPNPAPQWHQSPPDVWTVTNSDINAMTCSMAGSVAHPESVFSIGTDEDGTATGDELFGNDWGSGSSTHGSEAYHAGIIMPQLTPDEHSMLSSMWGETTAALQVS